MDEWMEHVQCSLPAFTAYIRMACVRVCVYFGFCFRISMAPAHIAHMQKRTSTTATRTMRNK